jgi:ABC-type uncharacterized transport system substrate-binding protein
MVTSSSTRRLGGAVVCPLTARAQQPAVPVVAVLSGGGPDFINSAIWRAFREGLNDAGYVDGRNVAIEYSWADNRYDRLPVLAAELVRRRVAVIVAGGVLPAQAARAATATIPIVFQLGIDPVAIGLVASLNRPGGNVTGSTNITVSLVTKRLQLVRQLLPAVAVIGVLVNPANRFARGPIERLAGGRRRRWGCNCAFSMRAPQVNSMPPSEPLSRSELAPCFSQMNHSSTPGSIKLSRWRPTMPFR